MQIVSVSDFRSNISEYLNQIKYGDTGFLIKKGNKIIAQVSKPKKTTTLPQTGFADKWHGAFKVNESYPADKIRDFIDYSDL